MKKNVIQKTYEEEPEFNEEERQEKLKRFLKDKFYEAFDFLLDELFDEFENRGNR